MTAIILCLFIVSLFILDPETRNQILWACRSSGRRQPEMALAYRGTGRLGFYRASERG